MLLQNKGALLPLAVGAGKRYSSIAVIGPNAGCLADPTAQSCDAISAQLGGYTSTGAAVFTVAAAVNASAAALGARVTFARGCNIDDSNTSLIAAAVAAAAAADVAIVVVGDSSDGYGRGSCAEGIDADSLDLPGGQLPLLAALSATATPLVVVLIHGRPATFGAGPQAVTGANNGLLARLPALLACWRPGEEGGSAIWDALTGAVNPSGRLAQSWVRHVGAIRGPANPWFQARGTPTADYVSEPATPLFHFGYGLSYTTFTVSGAALQAPPQPLPASAVFNVTARVSTAGPAASLVLQVYFSQDAPTKYVRTQSALLCFAKVALPANAVDEPVSVADCRVTDMEAYDPDAGAYVTFPGPYTLTLAQSSADPDASQLHIQVA